VRNLDLSGYDAVINDSNGISLGRAPAAQTLHRPEPSVRILLRYTQGVRPPVQQVADARFAPCQQKIGLHWHHFDQPILPPLIDRMQRATRSATRSSFTWV